MVILPIPVAVLFKMWVCGRSLAGIMGLNSGRGMDVCLLFWVCCEVVVSASGSSLIQRSPTERGVLRVIMNTRL